MTTSNPAVVTDAVCRSCRSSALLRFGVTGEQSRPELVRVRIDELAPTTTHHDGSRETDRSADEAGETDPFPDTHRRLPYGV